MPALATVNGEALDLADALRRSIVHEEDFLNNSVNTVLIRQRAAKLGISNTDEELQLAADELRYNRGLESVEKLQQWMKASNQTVLSLQNAIDGMLLRNKVRNSIREAEIEAYFAEHKLEFDSVELYSIRVDSLDKANELLAEINDEGANFHVLAMAHSQDEQSKPLGGYVGNLTRGGMTGEIEAAVFKAQPGKVIGPIKTEKGYNLFKVAAIHPASLEKAKEAIRMSLFDQLLAKLRAEAAITYPILAEAAAAV